MTEDVLVAGDTLVDFLPDGPGPVGLEHTYAPKFGGSAANVALALDCLGAPPLFWTRVGGDGFGDALAETLAESGVGERFVVRDDEAATTLAFVASDADGEPTFEFHRTDTADTRMQPGTVPDRALEALSWVHITGVTLSVEPSRTATLDLAERATAMGCTVSLDPNARPEMWNSDEEFARVIRSALAHVDVLKATPEDLAAAGFEADDPERLAATISEHGPHSVLITLGAEGALAYGSDGSTLSGFTHHGGHEVDAVDTTGAGDSFLAAAIAALNAGVDDADRLLELATGVGAVTTTRQGATAGLADLGPLHDLVGPLPWE